ncbi:3-phosphoserine/phosphohydroxythreonine transaminase [Thalassoroseus pseudoceratinae]|uniref:3-phosphoserine/phosphohydroxythreonine transaminase n=1 Tax=Thalassoroseus pseudoceratinae TaxID=2713176 RepID=UPI00141EF09F|nr:3-phosphoserine/phosphohydroxythreonine transaminase [Thalassoroseus pseudoceratinae]
MVDRKINFSAGPAALPLSVLEEAQEALISLDGTGIGVLEHSHRGKAFVSVYENAVKRCREVAGISDDYDILFLQGGASTQFFMVPMNFLDTDQTADYLVTGSWSQKAVKEAKKFGNVNIVCSSEDRNFCYIPKERKTSSSARYVHFTSNNTIYGTEFSTEPEVPNGAFLACDASSDIFSRPLDVNKYGMIYAGAQKNLGPSGVTLVIVRKDLVEQGKSDLPTMLQYRTHADKESMFNTPPTFGIYIISLTLKWIQEQGGLEKIGERNAAKAATLYSYLDQSQLFKATADTDSRSKMNVCFVTGDADKDAAFIKAATEAGFDGLKGHRSVGGMRASIYNAFEPQDVESLVAFMRDFEQKNG